MAESISWQCPFCQQIATIQGRDMWPGETTLQIDNSLGRCTLRSLFVVCPNKECSRFALKVELWHTMYDIDQYGQYSECNMGSTPIASWPLIPQSGAKVLPEYVPKPIVEDYLEACAVKELSPKASATLARRCLQGMIRDFWGISKPRLIDEIEAIKEKVDSDTWRAIEVVRRVGNVGAHMETDINVIVEVQPEEAGLLIKLIETLIDEWYVTRHDRQQRMRKVAELGQAMREKKKAQGPQPPQQ